MWGINLEYLSMLMYMIGDVFPFVVLYSIEHTKSCIVQDDNINLSHYCAASSIVHRLYSPTSEIGHSHACGNVTDRVILTCHATGSRVTWTATSDLFRRIIFSNSDAAWKVINQGVITGILLQNEPELDGSNMRNFISELLVYTTSSSMSVNITCSSDSGSSSHVIAPPGNTYTVYHYRCTSNSCTMVF